MTATLDTIRKTYLRLQREAVEALSASSQSGLELVNDPLASSYHPQVPFKKLTPGEKEVIHDLLAQATGLTMGAFNAVGRHRTALQVFQSTRELLTQTTGASKLPHAQRLALACISDFLEAAEGESWRRAQSIAQSYAEDRSNEPQHQLTPGERALSALREHVELVWNLAESAGAPLSVKDKARLDRVMEVAGQDRFARYSHLFRLVANPALDAAVRVPSDSLLRSALSECLRSGDFPSLLVVLQIHLWRRYELQHAAGDQMSTPEWLTPADPVGVDLCRGSGTGKNARETVYEVPGVDIGSGLGPGWDASTWATVLESALLWLQHPSLRRGVLSLADAVYADLGRVVQSGERFTKHRQHGRIVGIPDTVAVPLMLLLAKYHLPEASARVFMDLADAVRHKAGSNVPPEGPGSDLPRGAVPYWRDGAAEDNFSPLEALLYWRTPVKTIPYPKDSAAEAEKSADWLRLPLLLGDTFSHGMVKDIATALAHQTVDRVHTKLAFRQLRSFQGLHTDLKAHGLAVLPPECYDVFLVSLASSPNSLYRTKRVSEPSLPLLMALKYCFLPCGVSLSLHNCYCSARRKHHF